MRGIGSSARQLGLLLATAVAAAGLLAGCTGAVPESSSVPAEDWDLSPEDYQRLYLEFVDGLQEQHLLDSPVEPQLVRYVDETEWAVAQVSCLTEAGFPAEVNAQRGITFGNIPVEQAEAQREAAAACAAKYPVDPRYNLPLPRKRAELQYEFLVDTVGPCVESLGYSLSSPPSLQVWLDEYYASGFAWDPYGEVLEQTSPGGSDLDDVYQRCTNINPDVYPPESGP